MNNQYWFEIYTNVKVLNKKAFNTFYLSKKKILPNVGRGYFNIARFKSAKDLSLEFCLIGSFDYKESKEWLISFYKDLPLYSTFLEPYPFKVFANILNEKEIVEGQGISKSAATIEHSFEIIENFTRYFEC